MELLNDTYFWVTASFILFIIVAVKFGRAPILGALDTRIASVRADLAAAETARDQARALLADFEQRQQDAARQADALVDAARAQADALRIREEENLNQLMHRKEQQLSERLAVMRDQAIEELRAIAAQLAFEATRDMVIKSLDDQTRTRLVDRALDQVTQRLQ